MSYRGDDLDLRTPYARVSKEAFVAGAPGLNGGYGRGAHRSEPLLVDEAVLAVSNHAFDVAQAHGAAEVGLEHLVHALTRVEAAVDVLTRRGVREAALRRESATVIASEIPAAHAQRHEPPRSSPAVEEVLRRASEVAGRRGAPASIDDLLWVLLNSSREQPAIALLQRHAPDWQSWDWPQRRDAHTLVYDPAQGSPPLIEASGRALETVLDEKLGDVARIAQSLNQSLADRLQSLETAVTSTLTENARHWADMDEKLKLLSGGDTLVLMEQIEGLAGRLGRIEAALEARRDEIGTALAEPLLAKFAQVEAGGERRHGEGVKVLQVLGERLAAVEGAIGEAGERVAGVAKSQQDDMEEMREGLVKLGNNQRTLADNLDRWRLETSGDIGIVSNRLGHVEQVIEGPQGLLQRIGAEVQFLHDRARARFERRSGFKRWLFGTDRVFADSWQAEADLVRERLRDRARRRDADG